MALTWQAGSFVTERQATEAREMFKNNIRVSHGFRDHLPLTGFKKPCLMQSPVSRDRGWPHTVESATTGIMQWLLPGLKEKLVYFVVLAGSGCKDYRPRRGNNCPCRVEC